MSKQRFDVIIAGAGASGLMAGKTAAAAGLSVLVLDHAGKAARKIRISGGGKANFTNLNMGPEYYVGSNPQFCRSALARFSPQDSLAWVHNAGIRTEEREHGQVFCRSSANDLASLILGEFMDAKGELLTGCKIIDVKKDQFFSVRVKTDDGLEKLFLAPSLIIATGGPAWPKTGATSWGLNLARRFGHPVIEFAPALSGLVMPDDWRLAGLAGISLGVTISVTEQPFSKVASGVKKDGAKGEKQPAGKRTGRGAAFCSHPAENLSLVFTHTGISGPAALQASLYWQPGQNISIDFLPGFSVHELIERSGKLLVKNMLRKIFPDRLADALAPSSLGGMKVAELSREQREKLAGGVHQHTVRPLATEGFARAEVARGGVDTAKVSSKTMESELVPGLFFCGEVLDVTGRLGGYNLHWAFASGLAAGQAVTLQQ